VFGDNGQFKVAVYKCGVDVRTGDNQIAIRSGETFALDLSDPSRYNLAKSIAEGSYDDWNQERANYTQSYASASTYSADASYNGFSPAYSYGLADLAYYGNYFYAPGWGWMWRPYYVGAAWNPFMDGAWAWYPQFGYMWVSPYPWGWMPYRYGAWNFVPGYGWCWMPGTTWGRWAPVTAVNNPPVNWVPLHPPAAPPHPGSTGIVTVGRGWQPAYPPGSPPAANSLVSSGPSHQVWGASPKPPVLNWTPNNGVITNNAVPLRPLIPPATAPAAPAAAAHSYIPHAAPKPPANRPSPPAVGPRPQFSPQAHAWGGEHAGASNVGGRAGGGGGGGHVSSHR